MHSRTCYAKNALDAGANREEILETSTVAMAFGGGPAMAYSSTLLMDAIMNVKDNV
ncbi:carboxymuconolactone decarboxylase family protein [Clostridium niameyense]|uniref:carboxymuconolactone decarboxylase family protein n=1 Tax=Clostridium niameyense TaxID=1622073 RepID=UPI000A7E71EA